MVFSCPVCKVTCTHLFTLQRHQICFNHHDKKVEDKQDDKEDQDSTKEVEKVM